MYRFLKREIPTYPDNHYDNSKTLYEILSVFCFRYITKKVKNNYKNNKQGILRLTDGRTLVQNKI